MDTTPAIKDSVVGLVDSFELARKMNHFYEGLFKRLDTMQAYEIELQKLGAMIFADPMVATPNTNLKYKIEVYEKMNDLILKYYEAVRKTQAQLDMEKFLKAQGMLELLSKYKALSPEAAEKVRVLLSRVENTPTV